MLEAKVSSFSMGLLAILFSDKVHSDLIIYVWSWRVLRYID